MKVQVKEGLRGEGKGNASGQPECPRDEGQRSLQRRDGRQ